MSKYITKITIPAEATPPQGRNNTKNLTLDIGIDMSPYQEFLERVEEFVAAHPESTSQQIYRNHQFEIYNLIEETINNTLSITPSTIVTNTPAPVLAVPIGHTMIRRVYPVDERFLEPLYENVRRELIILRGDVPVPDTDDWFDVPDENVVIIG